jgi:peptidoglycan/xylan/chitin deacetylase (PgdA/CDA1 family)
MYHRLSDTIVDPDEAIYTVTPSQFDVHMKTLAENELPVVALDAFASGRFAHRAVALTFDDGCESDFSVALPVLKDYRFTAAFFVNPAQIGVPGFLTWRTVEQLADAGMTIGSHGHDHRNLSRLNPSELERQLAQSKALLEERLEREITALSLPGGKGGRPVAQLARRLGYRTILGSKPAWIHRESPPMILPRLAVRRGQSLVYFEGWVTQKMGPRVKEAARYYTLGILRRLVGGRLYERARQLAFPALTRNGSSEQT